MTYIPKPMSKDSVFKEMEIFDLLYDVSHYESNHEVHIVNRYLKNHVLTSSGAKLSDDTLLKYISSTKLPGSWRGVSYMFMLHWKDQVVKYKKLKLDKFGYKHKLKMLQDAIGDMGQLLYVKQLEDEDIARGLSPLIDHSYLGHLLSV
jgi:hypothetical protein